MQKRTRKFISSACVCAALLWAAAPSFAQSSPSASPGMSPTSSSDTAQMTNGGNQFVLGSKITGCTVKNQQGATLGTISNIIVNANTGHIRYAVLSTGGKKVTVPWNALNPAPHAANGETPHFVLNSTKEKLAKAPAFHPHDLAGLANRTMEEPIFTYYDIIWFPDTLTSEELGSRSGQGTANSSASPTATPSSTPESTSSNYGSAPTATASPYPSISPR